MLSPEMRRRMRSRIGGHYPGYLAILAWLRPSISRLRWLRTRLGCANTMGNAMNHRCLVPILAVAVAIIAGPTRASLLYVVQNDNVYSYDVSLGNAGAITASRQTVLSGSPYLSFAQDIVFDSAGNFYVSSLGGEGSNGWVTKFNAFGSYVSTITELMNGPTNLAVNSANSLYVLNIGPHPAVVEYTSAGAVYGSIANLPETPGPGSLAVSGAGDIYIGFYVDSGARIRMYGSDMVPTGTINSNTNWNTGLAVNSDGDLYSVDSYGYVDVFSSTGSFQQQFGTGNPSNLSSAAFDSTGNLYVLSGSDSISIAMFSTSGQYQYSWAVGTGVNGIAYGPVIVPEPSTYAMAFGGMAVVGWQMLRGRRRRDQTASSPR